VLDYVRANIGATNDTGELERTILVIAASGSDPRAFAGRDLVSELRGRRASNGSWQGNNTWTSFGILALRAGGAGGVGRSARWLARGQNRDGGFGFRPGSASSVDDTGAALQALAAAGRRGSKAVRRAVRYLRRAQNGDGGFPLIRRQSSNSQSTSWAVQGLVAAGRKPGAMRRGGRSPLAYLRSLQSADGSIRFSRSSRQTPVWTTSQAIDALARKAFPLEAPARAAGADGGEPAGGSPGKGAESGKKKPGRDGQGDRDDAAPAGPSPAEPPPAAPPAADVSPAAAGAGAGADGGGFAWGAALAAGTIAAVAAFAAWRLARRRGIRV
jgi:energy-coupling factor transport system substrate-specific component